MREFGKVYNGKGDVYIKIRVELLSEYGNHSTFVMSFHYAKIPFTPEMFPYKKKDNSCTKNIVLEVLELESFPVGVRS